MDVVIVGAGPSGLGTAAMLRRARVRTLVLERGELPGTSWRTRYDGLRLNTLRWLSASPGMPIPRRFGRWVSREDYVAYLERYVEHHRIDVAPRTSASRVERADDRWAVHTSRGMVHARTIVIATGLYHTATIPPWPGLDGLRFELVHAADVVTVEPFIDRRVLVVGAGNTGTELAQQLADSGAAEVMISVRTPPNLLPREFLKVPLHPLALLCRPLPAGVLDRVARLQQRLAFGDLSKHGLSPSRLGVHSASRIGTPPVIDDGFARLVRDGRIRPMAPLLAFRQREVIFADGSNVRPDVVIAATGYRPGLEQLVGHLGVLTPEGKPSKACRDWSATCGLHFVGFAPRLGGLLFDIGLEARRTAKTIVSMSRAGGRHGAHRGR